MNTIKSAFSLYIQKRLEYQFLTLLTSKPSK